MTIAYLGWFGPRGLASIVFAVLVTEANIPHDTTIVDAAVLTVIASIVLHGLTAKPLTERYTYAVERQPLSHGIERTATKLRVPTAGRWPVTPRR